MHRWLAALATAAAAGSAHAACTPEDDLARLTSGEVHCILNQALEVAARSSQTELTVALSDRVGNVLAVYRTGTANGGDGATVTIRSAPGASGGLEGISEATFNDVLGEVPTITLPRPAAPFTLIDALVAAKLAPSKGQARKDIEGGGIYLNNARAADITRTIADADILFGRHVLLRKGKRTYAVLTIA